jgi:plasmid stabilization system protein ParE
VAFTGFRDYLIFYRELPDRVEIVRVLHGARDIERILRNS